MAVYVYVDESIKNDINNLTVHFDFPSDMNADECIANIDKLVSLADNDDDIKILSHEHSVFSVSQFSPVAETIK